MADCPFCIRIARGEIIIGNDVAAALYDRYPVSPGHTLIVPIGILLISCHDQGRADSCLALVDPARQNIEENHSPDGYNIGINIGISGGQTIPHAHLHVIPRYSATSRIARWRPLDYSIQSCILAKVMTSSQSQTTRFALLKGSRTPRRGRFVATYKLRFSWP